jgi:hypothetical protein
MIITLKTTLVRGRYCKENWSANIELDESSKLDDLHCAIQDAVEFEEDHLYCFFLARAERSQDRKYFDDENGLIYSKKIREMFPLPDKKCLFYLFDWGDEWVFKISSSRKRPHEAVKGVTYPRVESELGIKPEQYPGDDEDY